MTEPILEVRDLHVEIPTSRGVVHAVDGASFTLEQGDVLGLVGESGCGKTMTLRAICGLLVRPAHIVSGQVLYNGVDLTQLSPRSLRAVRGRQISLIFQEPMTALNPVMRVGDQIAEGPRRRLDQGRDEAGRPRSRCCSASASRTRSAASRPTRTSSRAACASAS